MIDFGRDIETDSATESKGKKRKFVIALSDDEDIEDEENDYEILDEEGRVKAFCQSLEDADQCPGHPSRLGHSAGID
jgi:hypothetical protein